MYGYLRKGWFKFVMCTVGLIVATKAAGATFDRPDLANGSPSTIPPSGRIAQAKPEVRQGTGDVVRPEAPAGSQSEKQTAGVRVVEFLVEGNTILAESKINAVLEKYKGTAVQFRDIDQARSDLEKAYHEAGYPTVLVNLPEQTIEEGIVTLRVIEAPLVEIKVTGQEHYSKYRILEKLPSIKIGTVLYEPAMVKELAAVNSMPDLKVAPVLQPGSEPGTVALELKVKDRLPVHGKVEADNRGPITTPRDRLLVEVQHADLFGGDEILTVNTVQTPTDWGAVQNYGASFVLPVKWPDHLLAVYASKSQSTSTLTSSSLSVGAGAVTIAGNAVIAGMRYIFPIFSGGSATHQLSVGLDYKHLNPTEGTFPGGLGTVTVLNGIQYLPASANYVGLFPDRTGVTKVSGTAKGYVAGIIPGSSQADFGGSGTPGQPGYQPPIRVGSTGTFLVLQGGLDRTQALPWDSTLNLHIDGQWGSQPLIPTEQYFAGGMDTVRGYINYEVAGDNAVRGRAEVTSPDLLAIPLDYFWSRRKSAEYTVRLRFAAFYDAARLWVQQPQPGQIDKFQLQGTGFGIRGKLPKDVGQFQVDQGWALHDTPTTKRGDTFVHFSVGIGF